MFFMHIPFDYMGKYDLGILHEIHLLTVLRDRNPQTSSLTQLQHICMCKTFKALITLVSVVWVYITHLLVNNPLQSATIKKNMIALLGKAELATFI